MTLTLKITNRDRLENGSPTEMVVHERGLIIGRSQTCGWALPDSAKGLSREHCKITYRDEAYFLDDTSTNGTFLLPGKTALSGAHKITSGDRFGIGPFDVSIRLSGAALAREQEDRSSQAEKDKGLGWGHWDSLGGQEAAPTPPQAEEKDLYPQMENEGWVVSKPHTETVSDWADTSDNLSFDDNADVIFDTLTGNHDVDWSDISWDVDDGFDPFEEPGSKKAVSSDQFGSLNPNESDPFSDKPFPADTQDSPSSQTPDWPSEKPAQAKRDPFGSLHGDEGPSHIAGDQPLWEEPPQNPTIPLIPSEGNNRAGDAQVQRPIATPLSPKDQTTYRELVKALGVSDAKLKENPEETAARVGRMLRRLVTGLMKLLEARARAKDAMGASATQLRFEGNNPLKFALDVEQALQMILNPALKGYMEAELAIEDSYRDLQAHQIATLKAMQGALKATLANVSPDTIRKRADSGGLISKLLPGQRDAALWRAYEEQFSGAVQGSAEAFLDTFSKEFKEAYEEATRK